MNDMLVVLMLANIEAKKGLEELLTELVHRVLEIEKELKDLKEA
jgi:type III secretory pathway lipoprotein EscJ